MWTEARQYNRQVQVIVSPGVDPSRPDTVPIEARTFNTRTSFVVNKSILSETKQPNTAKVSLFNLSENSRAFFESKRLWMWIKVGYGRTKSFTPWETIFFGDVGKVRTVKSSGDIVLDVECADGYTTLKNTAVSIGFGPNCTNHQILNAVLNQMNIARDWTHALPVKKYKNGYTALKLASKILDELCDATEFEWSITNGKFTLSRRADPNKETWVVLKKNTGLLGIPTKVDIREGVQLTTGTQSKEKTEPFFECRCLLNPKINPGGLIMVSWEKVKDMKVKVRKVTYAGDSQEGLFECQIEGVKWTNP